MPLSEDEQRRLDEMEGALLRDDPGFAANVSMSRVRTRRRISAALGFLLGIIILIGGLVITAAAVLAGVLISVAGLLLMSGFAITVFRWLRRP
jgi:hypothetical protein